MSALREEIRAILREEIAALRAQTQHPAPSMEHVRITSSAELNRFAQDLVRRAGDPEFANRVARGDLMFALAETGTPSMPIVSGPPCVQPDVLDKALITERDIAALGAPARSLRIGRHSRLTPLARDEARRKGIRIERTDR